MTTPYFFAALPESLEPGDWYINLRAFADVARPLETVPVHLPDGS